MKNAIITALLAAAITLGLAAPAQAGGPYYSERFWVSGSPAACGMYKGDDGKRAIYMGIWETSPVTRQTYYQCSRKVRG